MKILSVLPDKQLTLSVFYYYCPMFLCVSLMLNSAVIYSNRVEYQ